MSKINALEFGKYVENCRQSLKQILQSRNINIESDSLNNLVAQTDLMTYKTGYYKEPKLQYLLDLYENDIELIKNNGQYKYCIYAIIAAMSNVVIKNDWDKIIVEDDTTYTNTSENQVITLDLNKCSYLEDGTPVFILRLYRETLPTTGKYQYTEPFYANGQSESNSSAIYYLFDANTTCSTNTSGYSIHNSYKCRALIFGTNVTNFSRIPSGTKYLKTFATSINADPDSGEVMSPDIYIDGKMNILSTNVDLFGAHGFAETFDFSKISGTISRLHPYGSGYLSKVDLSNSDFKFNQVNNQYDYDYCLEYLKLSNRYEELDWSTLFGGGCYNLQTLITPNTVSIVSNVDFRKTPNLSIGCLETIIDNMTQLTNTLTFTISSAQQVYFSTSLLTKITNKGFTISVV